MVAKRCLNRLLRFEIHPLSEISNSQVTARGKDGPGIGLFHSSKDAHQRGFAGTIWTDESNPFVVADAERYIFEYRLNAVGFVNVVSSKHEVSCNLKTKTEGKPSA